VYAPNTPVTPNGFYASAAISSSGSISLSNLPATGTYTVVVFTPGEPGTAQITAAQVTTQAVPTNGTRQAFTAGAAGQSVFMTFAANQGSNFELSFSNISGIDVSSGSLMVNVYDSNGVNVLSAGNAENGWSSRYPLWNLAAGTYTIVVSPPDATSKVSFDFALIPDTVGPALSLNTPATVNLALGQVERLTFSANSGNNLVLGVTNASTSNPSGLPVTVSVYSPDNSPITTANASATGAITGAGNINLVNLPMSGTYTVIVWTSGVPGTAQLTLTNAATPQSVPQNGSPQAYTANSAGQSVFMTFTATQGENLEFSFSNISGIDVSSGSLMVNVYDSNGVNVLSAGNAENGWSSRYPLWNLAAGTYTIVVSPPDAISTISFDASLQSDILGPGLSTEGPVTVSLNLGQVERLTFGGNAGDSIALYVSNAETNNPSGLPVSVSVFSPNSGSITTTNAYKTAAITDSAVVSLPNLPASGVYTVVVSTSGETGSALLQMVAE
jgi:flagellar hook assembly protein FlgD